MRQLILKISSIKDEVLGRRLIVWPSDAHKSLVQKVKDANRRSQLCTGAEYDVSNRISGPLCFSCFEKQYGEILISTDHGRNIKKQNIPADDQPKQKIIENEPPLQILKVRLAKGEISKEEFEELVKL